MGESNGTKDGGAEQERPRRAESRAPRHVLITGFPGFISKRLFAHLLEAWPRARFTLLCEERRRAEADAAVSSTGRAAARAKVTIGDVSKMDLGLAGLEIDALADVTHVFHLAGIQALDAPAHLLESVNVNGTRNTLALARELKKLERFVHFSSCLVSGDRHGVITEDELECGQRFTSAYEESKFKGERLARAAMTDLPVTVVRPSIVVGSSDTGEIDRFEGVYAMGILIVTSPISVPVPLPGDGTAPLNLVPVDFVVRAVARLAADPRAAGKTFHIVDPNPLSSGHVYALIAQRAGKKMAKSSLGSTVAARVLKLSGLLPALSLGIERLSRQRLPAFDVFDRFVVYNCSNTLALLEGSGIQCPRFDTYVDKLMQFVTQSLRQRRKSGAASRVAADPFE